MTSEQTMRLRTHWSWVDMSDPVFADTLHLILDTGRDLVIVGPGGVGKSVLLRMAADMLVGNTVVLATTGVASANLSGDGIVSSTIHTFFRFPALDIYEGQYAKTELVQLMESVDTILIDEISMLNASLMEAIFRTLRAYRAFSPRKLPRIIMFGDVLQLPPVVRTDDPAVTECFNVRYDGVHMFYGSPRFRDQMFDVVHLNRIYRQSDVSWQGILNRMRLGQTTQSDIDVLNRRVVDPEEFVAEHPYMMYLVGTHAKAKALNDYYLDYDGGVIYDATIEGKFKHIENIPEKIEIAPGMQVMCLHNNKQLGYQNGTLGRAIAVYPDSVVIRKLDGEVVTVQRERWEQYEYIRKPDGIIDHRVVGSMTQIGCKPAFACTIHKSQSLTLDSMMLDPDGINRWSPGLAYTALSRCTSLEGVGLARPLALKHIRVSKEGMAFINGDYRKDGIF